MKQQNSIVITQFAEELSHANIKLIQEQKFKRPDHKRGDMYFDTARLLGQALTSTTIKTSNLSLNQDVLVVVDRNPNVGTAASQKPASEYAAIQIRQVSVHLNYAIPLQPAQSRR